jgi:FkbM family methyltransferase
MSIFRDVVRRGVRRLGVESNTLYIRLKRFYPRPSDISRLVRMLASRKVTVVFDIGANVGQFGKELRLAGYRGRIVSFEPLSSAHARLTNTTKGDPNWIVAPQMAVGNSDGSVDINISGDSVSSSVLEMLDVHVEAAPDSVYIGREHIVMRKLDTLAGEYLKDEDILFLKADVQGCETQVLEGARELFPRIVGLHLEMALVPCYQGQPDFDQVNQALRSAGFSLWLLSPGTVDEHTGRQLQVDTVFFRDDAKTSSKSPARRFSTREVLG